MLTVGNDVRKAAADGFPVHQVLASDLRPSKHYLAFKQIGMLTVLT